MSVVIIGGHERMVTQYEEICRSYGCKAKVMAKEKGGFKKKIGVPDLIILFTNTVSHKMVILHGRVKISFGLISICYHTIIFIKILSTQNRSSLFSGNSCFGLRESGMETMAAALRLLCCMG